MKVVSIIYRARVVVDIDEKTGEEFAYLYTDDGWLNLTTEKLHSLDFMEMIALDVVRVDFGDESMTGEEWRDNDCPTFLRKDTKNEIRLY